MDSPLQNEQCLWNISGLLPFEKMSKPPTRSGEKKAETLAKDGNHEKSPTANANATDSIRLDTLDPTLFKAFLMTTEHLTQVIDNKLSGSVNILKKHEQG